MKRKILFAALLLAAIVVVGCVMFGFLKRGSESKKNRDMTGTCGEDLTYEYKAKSGKLIIKGTGEMTSCPWSGYEGVEVKSVEFEEGITSIYHGAFYAQSKLAGDIILPSTVNDIDDFAFYGTSALNSVTIPDGVTRIGDYAFRGSGIKGEIKLPDSVTYIGEECFKNCEGLAGELKLPASLEEIGRVAFNECKGLTGDLVIPDSVTKIGDYAFAGCTGFNGTLTISKNLTEIPENCFSQDSGFKGDLVIPDTVKVIGQNAFLQCGFDGTITLPAQMEEIDLQAFSHCENLKGNLVIPEGIHIIGSRAFEACKNLTSLNIPEGVNYIGNYAFSECSSMKGQLCLPDSLLAIGECAFYKCSSFEGDLVIPDRVVSIADGAFRECSGIGGTLKLSADLLNIGEQAFCSDGGIRGDLVIPDSVAVIGREAFAKCSGIKNIIVGKNATSMEREVFAGCDSLSGGEFTGEFLPDYYDKEDEEGGATFPEGITLTFPDGAKPVTDLWRSEQNRVKAEASKSSAEGLDVSAKEVPYYWTDNLREENFYGTGVNRDAVISFEESRLHIIVNGRDGGTYDYHADANSDDNSLSSDMLPFKDGYLRDLRYYRCYRGSLVKAVMVHGSGDAEDVYFATGDYEMSPDICVMISLEEDLFEEPF